MRRNKKLLTQMSITALLIALMFLMGFTPLGTLQIGPLTCTLLGLPLAIGAGLFGPIIGTVLGLTWGLISLIQGLTGIDASGPLLMEASTIGLVITCLVPRILTGFLIGIISYLVKKKDKKGFVTSALSSALTPVFNTLLFMTSFCLFFFKSPQMEQSILDLSVKYNFDPNNPILFAVFFVGINFFLEFAVNLIVGSTCIYTLNRYALKNLNLDAPKRGKDNIKG